MRSSVASIFLLAGIGGTFAQNWQTPGPIQRSGEIALPRSRKATGRAARIEGHTDAKGGDAYNMKLSEVRARTVRDWLANHGAIPAETPIKGYGKRVPIVPNTTSDGKDDPEGRQKNRRVEIVFETCKS